MLPFCFEWQWDVGHVIFFGLFYTALGVISLGLGAALFMTFRQLYSGAELPHHDEEEDQGPTYVYVHNAAARGEYA